jgi:hypothetical protein
MPEIVHLKHGSVDKIEVIAGPGVLYGENNLKAVPEEYGKRRLLYHSLTRYLQVELQLYK